jgi:diadenosine tetraphosphatase ApaH/serine/threonine PP2A family protein phosphatase
MKLALLSDIHANLRALQACLAHARAAGAERYAVLGDIVGYGAEPAAVVEEVMALAADGALVLGGNHDELAAHPPGQTLVRTMDEAGAQWTHDQLSPAQREFLGALPLSLTQDDMLLVHASADAPAQWRYVDDARVASQSLDAATADGKIRYVFGGHVHHQMLYYRGTGRELMRFVPTPGVAVPVPRNRQWLATAGAIGQPRDGNRQAMYALFDTRAERLSFHRVSYDHQSAADAIRAAGLPDYFAKRLEQGR